MALDATNEIINSSSGIVVQGTAVAGGYFVTAKIANIPSHAKIKGQLCYCTEDSQFYQYNGSSWAVAKLGGSGEYLTTGHTTISGGAKIISTGTDTPLNMQGNAASSWIGYYNSGAEILGYIGVDENKKPTFYSVTSNINKRIPTVSLSGTTLTIDL